MSRGLGSVVIGKIGHDELVETHYHTYRIWVASHTYIFHGQKSSLKDALEMVMKKTGSPYRPKYKEI